VLHRKCKLIILNICYLYRLTVKITRLTVTNLLFVLSPSNFSPFGYTHSTVSASAMKCFLEVLHCRHTALNNVFKTRPFKYVFGFGDMKMLHRAKSREVQLSSGPKCCVGRRMVMTQNPLVQPKIWSASTNVVP
jgi:hypothetical protein